MAGIKFWRGGSEGDDAPERQAAPAPVAPVRATPAFGSRSEAASLLRNFEESGQGWFWATDASGRLTYLTGSIAGHLATGSENLIGATFAELFARADDGGGGSTRTLPFILTKRSPFENLTLRAANGRDDRWWAVSGRPQFDGAGTFTGYLGSGADVTEQRDASEHASQLAMYDSLTGLPNRLRMSQVLQSNMAQIDLHKRPCAVFLIDLDRFKAVNDTLGHPAGDALLKQVAERLVRIVGDAEKVFRLGGDEFEVILRDIDDRGELGRIANDIIAIVSQPYSVEGSRCIIGASVGIAIGPFDGRTGEELIRNSDLALYGAKGGGRGRFRFFSSELLQAAEDKRLLESDLRDALTKGEMQLHYQPIVCAENNRPTGVEALLRWQHPKRGFVSPGIFIPIAEEANLIEQLGEWIIRKACEDAVGWPGKIRVAVNVSPIQFANEGLPQIVMSALANSGLSPDRLELEITEGVFMADTAETDAMFKALKGLGVRLALDDFGTGYSSLSYLRTAPFDKIKIDQTFVRAATLPGSRNAAIIAAIVALAGALEMETTAEGIESFDQLALIRKLHVSHVQGFIYSKAIPRDALIERLQDDDWRIEPSGPARQRSTRLSMFRKVGAIHNGGCQSVIIRNMSESGALIEGLADLPVDTLFILDFGEGQLTLARVRREFRGQVGVQFEMPMVNDEEGGLCTSHRTSPYALGALGVPDGLYPDEFMPLGGGGEEGLSIEHIAEKLGMNLALLLARPLRDDLIAGLNGRTSVLTAAEIERLQEAARTSQNPQLKHVVSLLLLTGARQRELLEARWEDFDLDQGYWNIPATHGEKIRVITLVDEAIEFIRALPRRQDSPYLICNPKTGRPYRSFTSSWETVRTRAGLPYVEIDELRSAAA